MTEMPTSTTLTGYTATTQRVWLPKAGHFAHFLPRPQMRRRLGLAAWSTWPATAIPTGWTTVDRSIVPMDGNDRYGDCGSVMAAHCDSVLMLRSRGQASTFDLGALEQQYLAVSGGDNGLDESAVVRQVWGGRHGIAGAEPAGAVLEDHLQIRPDARSIQGAIAHQGFVGLAFSVPDAWIHEFDPAGGTVWDAAPGVVGDANNGHWIALVGVDAQGRYVGLTWGSWVLVTQAGLESPHVEPETFTGFTCRAFNRETGRDFTGRTYEEAAAFWRAMGGVAPVGLPDAPTSR